MTEARPRRKTVKLNPAVCRIWLLGCALLIAGPAFGWDDTPLVRAEAAALLNGFNAEVLSHPSATLTLERWCADHRLATPPRIVAQLDRSVDKSATPDQRSRLAVGNDEPIAYRRVRLICGTHVLSEADNWYVPARLTPDMNKMLNETDTPFGRVVLALGFHRTLLSATLLWAPLPVGWETETHFPSAAGAELVIPDRVLEQRALLLTHDNVPFSEVTETYTKDLFDFGLPSAR